MAQVPHAEEGLMCPLHKEDMSKVCHKCPWWMHLRGKHPQSDQEMDQWNCAVSFLPVLLIENAQMSRQTGAAVESFRNVMVNQHVQASQIINVLGAAMRKQIDVHTDPK